MIKCYVNKHGHTDKRIVEAEGTVGEIANDIGNLTHTIYHHIKENDAEGAEVFKEVIQEIFAVGGTVWMTHEELLALEDEDG